MRRLSVEKKVPREEPVVVLGDPNVSFGIWTLYVQMGSQVTFIDIFSLDRRTTLFEVKPRRARWTLEREKSRDH